MQQMGFHPGTHPEGVQVLAEVEDKSWAPNGTTGPQGSQGSHDPIPQLHHKKGENRI